MLVPHIYMSCRTMSHVVPICIKPVVKPMAGNTTSFLDILTAATRRRYHASMEIKAIKSQQHPNDEGFFVEITCNGKKGKLFPDRITSNMRDAVLIDGSDEFISLGAFAKMADPDKYATSKTYKNMVRVLPYKLSDGNVSNEQGAGKFMDLNSPGHKTVRVGWEEEERDKVLQMRNKGLTQKQVAEEFNVQEKAIQKMWKRKFSKEYGIWRPKNISSDK